MIFKPRRYRKQCKEETAKRDEGREYQVPFLRKLLCSEELHPWALEHLKDVIKDPTLLLLGNHREQEKSLKTQGQIPSVF